MSVKVELWWWWTIGWLTLMALLIGINSLNSRRKSHPLSGFGSEVLRFRIDIQPSGACLLSTPVDAAMQFDSLTAALASARVTAADAEADIDIWMDGLYMFV